MTEEEARAVLAARDPVADWARCKGYVQDALDEGGNTHNLDDVAEGIAAGRYHFWALPNSAIITEIHEFPRARFLHVFLAGGSLDELLSAVPRLKSWAAFLKCSELTLAGRLGWCRVLKKSGWQSRLAVLSTAVETGSNGIEKPTADDKHDADDPNSGLASGGHAGAAQ
jgi:hypothetical protein